MPRCISKRVAPSATTRRTGKHNSKRRTKIYGMAKKVLTPQEKWQRHVERYDPVMAARQALRRAFSRSPVVIEMMRENRRKAPRFNKDGSRHKIDATEHLCNVCKKWKRSVKNSKVVIDHIDPVVEPEVGFVDMNTYFKRLWCDRSKLQKICGDCHRTKTNAEWFVRRFKDEQEILKDVEDLLATGAIASYDKKIMKQQLKRFTKKKLETLPYPDEFKARLATVQDQLK